MDKRILEKINDLLDSYDLLESDREELREEVNSIIPDILDEEFNALAEYLDEFYEYCLKFGDILAEKYKLPFIPKSEEAKKETADYVSKVQKKYPEINEEHIVTVFSTDCWLTNR